MKGIKYKAVYEKHSAKLSDITRQVSFAGIAIIWIFKVSVKEGVFIDPELVLPAKLLVIALALDVFQYLYQTVVWFIFFSYLECKKRLKEKVKAPLCLVIPAWIILFAKVILVIIAFYYIICELSNRLIM